MEAPRVNAQMLTNMTGKLVCLVGQVSEVSTSDISRFVLCANSPRHVDWLNVNPLAFGA